MVPEFDAVLFPETDAPPPGSVLGLILVTKLEVNRDQVEQKLAGND